MDRTIFRKKMRRLGLTVRTDRTDEPGDDPIVARTDAGDELWWSVDPDTEEWGIYADPKRKTFDDPFFLPDSVEVTDDALVLGRVTGTASRDHGYGRGTFDGVARVDATGVAVIETTTY